MVERGPNKSLPHELKRNPGPTKNPSDCPQVEIESLTQLRKFSPHGRKVDQSSLSLTKPSSVDNGFGITNGIVEIPLTKKPITKVFRVRHGGGRVYGGGTSEKSLQNAKKKNRKRKLESWFLGFGIIWAMERQGRVNRIINRVKRHRNSLTEHQRDIRATTGVLAAPAFAAGSLAELLRVERIDPLSIGLFVIAGISSGVFAFYAK